MNSDLSQAICRPLVNYRSDRYRRPNCLGFTAWALALVCSLPQLFIWHTGERKHNNGANGTVYVESFNLYYVLAVEPNLFLAYPMNV